MLFQQTLFLLISFFSIAVLGDNLGTGGIATVSLLLHLFPLILFWLEFFSYYPHSNIQRYWDCCRPSGSYSGEWLASLPASRDRQRSSSLTSFFFSLATGKAAVNQPVRACKKDGVTQNTNQNAQSGCQGGDSFSCNNYQPYVSSVSTLSYAFGARGQSKGEDSFEVSSSFIFSLICAIRPKLIEDDTFFSLPTNLFSQCACYALKFNQLAGKTLVVQATNTGGDVPPTNFDIQIPGK